jgi:polar amino acid transport system substrate-binding protein
MSVRSGDNAIVLTQWRESRLFRGFSQSLRKTPALATALTAALLVSPAFAQSAPAPAPTPPQAPVAAPSFWDPGRAAVKPDLTGLRQIRFLTEDDYPPFNFALPDGRLAGFNVDLARAICDELALSCTIQRRRWDLLIPSLNDNSGDAVIAALAINDDTRAKADFTSPYLTTPGRFATPAGSVLKGATPEDLDDRSIAVTAGSPHEAFVKTYYPKSRIAAFETNALARRELKNGHVNALFGDAISLSFWLNGAEAGGCCAFKDGVFTDPRYFGDGIGVAVKKGNLPLRRALDYALARIAQRGLFAEIYLKYFPVGPF